MQPCVPIVITTRTPDSIAKHGANCFVEWKPDSNMLVVAVRKNWCLRTHRWQITTKKNIKKNVFVWFFSVSPDQRRYIIVVHVVCGRHTKRHLQSNRSSVQEFMPRQRRIIHERDNSIIGTEFGKLNCVDTQTKWSIIVSTIFSTSNCHFMCRSQVFAVWICTKWWSQQKANEFCEYDGMVPKIEIFRWT